MYNLLDSNCTYLDHRIGWCQLHSSFSQPTENPKIVVYAMHRLTLLCVVKIILEGVIDGLGPILTRRRVQCRTGDWIYVTDEVKWL